MKPCLLLFSLMVIFFGCSGDKVDVVRNIIPVQIWDNGTYEALDKLPYIPDSLKLAFIKERLPDLTPTICRYAAARFPKVRIDSVVYSYGSGEVRVVTDGEGNKLSGIFKNELIASLQLRTRGVIRVFVRGLNHGSEIFGNSYLGAVPAQYIIRQDESLCHHLDYESALLLAKRYSLPIYKGKFMKPEFRISAAEAAKLDFRQVQISILVRAGDRLFVQGDDAWYVPAAQN